MVSRRSDSDLSKAQLYYDSGTGQVYTEAVVTAKAGKTRGPGALPRLKRVRETSGGHGAPSLERIALHTVLDNIYSLQPETIENVPWTVKRRLWNTCENSDEISEDAKFHLWKTFIDSQPPSTHHPTPLSYRHMFKVDTIRERLLPLPEYLTFINSPTTSWLTALTLSKLVFPRRDLYQLSKLNNLVALDICAPPDHALQPVPSDLFSKNVDAVSQPLVDNTVLRHFATHADVASAFQSLRVLILRGFKDVTSDCLQHLNSFPRLSLFGVQNCGLARNACHLRDDEKRARACGWTTEDERGLLGQLKHEIELSHTWDGMLKACVEVTAVFAAQTSSTTNALERAKSAEVPYTPRDQELSLEEWRKDMRRQDAIRRQRQHIQDSESAIELPLPQPDPPLLNFRIGPTSSDLIFSTPMVFFRCLHGHIQAESKDRVKAHKSTGRSDSKNRRPSGPNDPRAAKRLKLRAGRSVELTQWFEMQGVGRRLSSIELEKG